MTDWIKRKKTNEINVGSVKVGGDNPISIQSMTNTDTCNVEATIGQINDLKLAGADIVPIFVVQLFKSIVWSTVFTKISTLSFS